MALVLLTGLAACVSIPQDVKHTFEPPGPGETSYFVRRPEATRTDGFAAPAPQAPAPTPSSAPRPPPCPAPAPSAAASP